MRISTRRRFLATAGALAASAGLAGQSFAQTDSSSSTDTDGQAAVWSQFRSDAARTGAIAADAAPGGDYVTTSWYSNIGSYVGVASEALPVVGDGAVYRPFVVNDVQFRGGVVAFDAETGAERWRHVAPGYSRETGWPPGIGAAAGTPAVGDGRLFLTSEAGTSDAEYGGLHALDTQTGETVWAKTGANTEYHWGGTPILADGTLYVIRTGGPEATSVVAALDPETGETQWTTAGRPGIQLIGLADRTLYGTNQHNDDTSRDLVAWSAADGSVQWTTTVDSDVDFSDAAIVDDTIYRSASAVYDSVSSAYQDGPNEVVAHTTDDGSVRWRTTLTAEGEEPEGVLSAPAVADGTVYVHVRPGEKLRATDYGRGVLSTVYALDAESGEVQWTHDTSTALLGDPSVAGDTVYVGGHAFPKVADPEDPVRRHPTVHALSTTDGSEQWGYLVRRNDGVLATRTPTFASGTLYGDLYEPDDGYYEHGAFALETSTTAPDSENLPLSSDAPVARITTDPEDAATTDLDAGTTVDLDGSASTGEVETYEWDLDDTGSFETEGQTASVSLDFCGSLTVTLRVTGPDDARSTDSVTLSTYEEE